MNNPFSRPQAGAYKPYLVEALNKVGRTTEADEFAKGNMKLAILSSVTGGVRLFPELNEVCANALNNLTRLMRMCVTTFGVCPTDNSEWLQATEHMSMTQPM